MTPADVAQVFEQLNREGRATGELNGACEAFAAWLACEWDHLSTKDIALLTSIGAVLWREGYQRRY